MDVSTILGLLGAFGCVAFAIALGPSALAFADAPSALIVIGGSFAVTFIMFPFKVLSGSFKVMLKCFFYAAVDPRTLISQIVSLAEKARKESIVSLEKVRLADPFLTRGVQLVADGIEQNLLRTVMDIDMDLMQQRHQRGQDVFKMLGTYSPAFGMIGTLVGLIQMLQNMDKPETIGPAMAVALLTTFYGSMLSNCVFLPMSKKLAERSADEQRNMDLMKEGILSIQKGEHPALVKEKLQSFLPPSIREYR